MTAKQTTQRNWTGVHRAEVDAPRWVARCRWVSMSVVVREWWGAGLPLVVEPDVLLGDPGVGGVMFITFRGFLPRARGTPRAEWVEWLLPDGIEDHTGVPVG